MTGGSSGLSRRQERRLGRPVYGEGPGCHRASPGTEVLQSFGEPRRSTVREVCPRGSGTTVDIPGVLVGLSSPLVYEDSGSSIPCPNPGVTQGLVPSTMGV